VSDQLLPFFVYTHVVLAALAIELVLGLAPIRYRCGSSVWKDVRGRVTSVSDLVSLDGLSCQKLVPVVEDTPGILLRRRAATRLFVANRAFELGITVS
jgi:hypothetical protein